MPAEARTQDFLDEVMRFQDFERTTDHRIVDGIPYFVNQFWTSAQRQSHPLHEISYRACFKAQLPQFLIARLSDPGDLVFDPFMGRGTTPLQAAIMGRRPSGNDVNPLSSMLLRPRLRGVDIHAVAEVLAGIDWTAGEIEWDDLLAFYHPDTLRGLYSLRNWLSQVLSNEEIIDPVADWIRMVALNRLSGHSPGFLSGRSLPPNQAVSIKAQCRINERLGISPPKRDIPGILLKKSRSLLRMEGPELDGDIGLHVGPATSVPGMADASVALIVTSPPFLDVVDYARDNWLRCWFAGIDPNALGISMLRTETGWRSMIRDALVEQARILRPGGHLALEVGEVRKGRVDLERIVWEAAEGLPLERIGVLVNEQSFTKTANCWGIANNKGGTNSNRIVLMRRKS